MLETSIYIKVKQSFQNLFKLHYNNITLAEDEEVESMVNGNHRVGGEANNEEHIAIVELDQKFKVLGDFTMFTTKVRKWKLYVTYGN